jgi:hypothetical protein
MIIPDEPPIGSLVAYEYLWLSHSGVREDGVKVYLAALIFAKKIIGGVTLAHAVGISHKPPAPFEKALEIPRKLKRHLGLDERPAWIYTDQINQFAWPGYDLKQAEWLSKLPRARGTCVIGPLPNDWFALIKADVIRNLRAKHARIVRRT